MGCSELHSASFYNSGSIFIFIADSFHVHSPMKSTSYCHNFKGKVITLNSIYKY